MKKRRNSSMLRGKTGQGKKEKKKEEEGENKERVQMRKITILINQSRNYKEKLLCIIY
jgi:hypothetical protein